MPLDMMPALPATELCFLMWHCAAAVLESPDPYLPVEAPSPEKG
jgi:hypothetical protein